MPGRDGSGPRGWAPAGGGGFGRGAGPGGDCVCPNCGKKVPHTAGIPCSSVTCPGCGAKMNRGRV